MKPTKFFETLGAPLRNYQWSWGAVRPADGTVFLRVWQDEVDRVGDRNICRLTNHGAFKETPGDLGFRERLSHVELLRAGAPCYLVLCSAVNPKASPRTIRSFDKDTLFKAGPLIDLDGDVWIELGHRIDVRTLRPTVA